jgi:hypothetical protein
MAVVEVFRRLPDHPVRRREGEYDTPLRGFSRKGGGSIITLNDVGSVCSIVGLALAILTLVLTYKK